MNKVLQKISNGTQNIEKLMERRRWILPSILSVVLFLVAIWGIENFNQLLLYDDEFGYWTASAYLTGTDWTSVTSGIPYYSYGYGFMILTPIRLLFSEPSTMYQAAIVVNVLLLVASYWIARNVTKQLFEDAHWALIDVVCFVVMLYPSNIVFSHIAWAECTLVFVFWVFVWLSLRVIKAPTLYNHIGLACVVMIIYVLHQRTLAVAIATVMIMAWCFFVDKDRRKNVLAFSIVLLVLVVVHLLIKNDLVNDFYLNNGKVVINNFSGHSQKFTNLFLGKGIIELFKSMLAKWFYLFVATFMMAWWGAEALFKNASYYIKSFVLIDKKKKNVGNLAEQISLWYIWLLLAFGGNFFITSLYMNSATRNDMVVYGRYNEYMIGIYFVVGILAFLGDKKWGPKIMAYIPITMISAWICQKIMDTYGLTAYQAYHSICTSLYLKKGEAPNDGLITFAIVGLAITIFLVQVIKISFIKISSKVKACIVVAFCSIFFAYTAYQLIYDVMVEKQLLRIVNIQNIVSWVEQVDDDASQNVYYCSDTESRYWSESFQFLLDDKPLTVIESENIDIDEDAFYIVGKSYVQLDGFDNYFYCIKESNQFALIVNKYGDLAETAREIKGE